MCDRERYSPDAQKRDFSHCWLTRRRLAIEWPHEESSARTPVARALAFSPRPTAAARAVRTADSRPEACSRPSARRGRGERANGGEGSPVEPEKSSGRNYRNSLDKCGSLSLIDPHGGRRARDRLPDPPRVLPRRRSTLAERLTAPLGCFGRGSFSAGGPPPGVMVDVRGGSRPPPWGDGGPDRAKNVDFQVF